MKQSNSHNKSSSNYVHDPDNRPIKGSSTGKYNMNFIDQTNDLASYCNGQEMDPQLQALIEHFQTLNYHGNFYEDSNMGVFSNPRNNFVSAMGLCESSLYEREMSGGKGEMERNVNREKYQKSMGNSKKAKELVINDHCSVCTLNFQQKQEIKILPCKHCFHKHCIKPWFQVNSKCPNCRFDLYEQK